MALLLGGVRRSRVKASNSLEEASKEARSEASAARPPFSPRAFLRPPEDLNAYQGETNGTVVSVTKHKRNGSITLEVGSFSPLRIMMVSSLSKSRNDVVHGYIGCPTTSANS